MSNTNRRDALKLMALSPLAAGFTWVPQSPADVQHLVEQAARVADDFEPQFFTEHELETVNVLVDMIIPADDRSGSATEVGVPAFMDFMMIDRPSMQTPMRGGLAWLDYQCTKQFEKRFADCTEAQRTAMLDQIAYPDTAEPDMEHGVEFFNGFRDLTASGFWSSKVGVEDLQYIGNTFVHEWTGAPQEELDRLGLSYDE